MQWQGCKGVFNLVHPTQVVTCCQDPILSSPPPSISLEQGLHLLLMGASENQRLVGRPGFQTCKNMTPDRIYQLVSCIKMLSGPARVLHWPACSWATTGSTWRCCVGRWALPHKRQCPTNNWFYRSWPESAQHVWSRGENISKQHLAWVGATGTLLKS